MGQKISSRTANYFIKNVYTSWQLKSSFGLVKRVLIIRYKSSSDSHAGCTKKSSLRASFSNMYCNSFYGNDSQTWMQDARDDQRLIINGFLKYYFIKKMFLS